MKALTNRQKEYFYATGTLFSLALLGVMIPPLAPLAFGAAAFAGICILAVVAMDVIRK